MWLVRYALMRPYTIIVLAILIFLMGINAIKKMPTDIFPNINIPVASVVWTYTYMSPEQIANFITTPFEIYVSNAVNNVEKIETEALLGLSISKIYFTQNSSISLGIAQLTSLSMNIIKYLPFGITPPAVLEYDASSVPLLRLVISSDTLTESEINDIANNQLRPQLATVEGSSIPLGFGGKVRQIMVDLNNKAMQQYGLSAQNVNNEIMKQNLILPAGTEKIGQYEYFIKTNNSPQNIEEFNRFPVKSGPNSVIYTEEIAHIRDGFIPQTNIVNLNGQRAIMLGVEKNGNFSSLNIINGIQKLLPQLKSTLNPALKYAFTSNQAVFIISAIQGVLVEGFIAALLISTLILIFLGRLESTFIILISIPLSILVSLALLHCLGHTLNSMTLGGLALAMGILVDDATVTIENMHYHLEKGKLIEEALLLSAEEIAFPAILSTLCICTVFIPLFFLNGISKYLFPPMAEAIIFAMLASYFLSRTLVPAMAKYLLSDSSEQKKDWLSHFRSKLIEQFSYFQELYVHHLESLLHRVEHYLKYVLGLVILSIFAIFPFLGADFFPKVDASEILLHYSAPPGTRVEETAKIAARVNQIVRQVIPKSEIQNIVDNIGLPVSTLNLTYNNSGTNGANDADTYISLSPKHQPIKKYIPLIREQLRKEIPEITTAFLPADIVNQILNFGIPSQINIQIRGKKMEENLEVAHQLLRKIQLIPGIVDARIRESNQYPAFQVDINKTRAKELGFTQADIAENMFLTLTGGFQTTPSFWADPKEHLSYPLNIQCPQYQMTSLNDLINIPITNSNISSSPQILGAVANIYRSNSPLVVSHRNIAPVINIYAGVENRDLASVGKDINKQISTMNTSLPVGSEISVNGQIQTQKDTFQRMYAGIFEAIIFVYLLMVVHFQSWLYPALIIAGLPVVFSGAIWMLFITHTTVSIPALTGSLMCIGVAMSNGILMVSFARDYYKQGLSPLKAALQAANTRLRPIVMTNLAMILGMCPMALGLGDGGEQNAPLGRAVIGGLLFALPTTLYLLPSLFFWIFNRESKK